MAPRHLLFGLVPLCATVVVVPSAGAHTQVQRATPGPGESVEGEVDSVELDFLDPVAPTPVIEVTGPDGKPVPGLGEVRLIADDIARVTFDPLTAAGDYQVDYSYMAPDGAAQEGAHQFGFQPSTDAGPEERDVPGWVLGAVLAGLAVAGLAIASLVGRRRAAG